MTAASPVFYYRDGCHLCEALAATLFRGWPSAAAAMEWRDVDSDPAWRAEYGLRVPVLMLGDLEVCALQADLDRISRYFGPIADPV
jgi:hypothetical protein